MEKIQAPKISLSAQTEDHTNDQFKKLLQTFVKETNWDGQCLYNYKGFWCPEKAIKGMIFFQNNFQSHDTDLILATVPKSGTTWLKALTFGIVNRSRYSLQENPVLTNNPHELVRFLELDVYKTHENPDLETLQSPRLFATHTPYQALPQCILDSKSKIVYLCRNPLDQFISYRCFIINNQGQKVETLSVEEAFELFCKGIHTFGPFWDHVLGYYNASKEYPQKVLFLQYENLMEDIISNLKRLAEFLEFPFSTEEEKKGVIEEIAQLCSFEKLKGLEVNKSNVRAPSGGQFFSFFRKGQVGDWANYLNPNMVEHLNKVLEEKIGGSGLEFKVSGKPSCN